LIILYILEREELVPPNLKSGVIKRIFFFIKKPASNLIYGHLNSPLKTEWLFGVRHAILFPLHHNQFQY